MMWHRVSVALLIMSSAIGTITGNARAGVMSTFDSGAEGWSVVTFGFISQDNYNVLGNFAAQHNANGGNPGGYISAMDPDSGDTTFSAPAGFLGNQSGATGLTYDLIYQGAVDYQTAEVMLTGNGLRLIWNSNPDITPGPAWMNVNVNFTPSSEWRVNSVNGNFATTADFQNVLSNLTGIFITGEYTNGLVETPGLDNVTLVGASAIPEPASFAVYALGFLGMGIVGAMRRKRKVHP